MIYDTTLPYPRDLIGYGQNPPHAQWPGGARIAVQFVLNYEEGGENAVLHGDAGSEQFLSEMFNPASYPERHMSMEGIYEYGARAGVWRILREFEKRKLPLTVFGVSNALQRHPELTAPCGAGPRDRLPRPQMDSLPAHPRSGGARAHARGDGHHPAHDRPEALGWYTGRDSPNTHRLVADYGGFEYDSDYYGDDLPFWMKVQRSDGTAVPQLIVPYTLDCNDMRFALPQGYSHADPFYQYLKDTFDALYAEGDPAGDNAPKMMSIGMHCRLLGRPGRITALQRFLDHIAQRDKVWVARRIDIARHWAQRFPAPKF
jgi:Predicted xylanase/chitin deacetylase